MHSASLRAFTLAEVLIVVAIIGVVASFGIAYSFDSYRALSVADDRDAILTALERARGESIHGICYGADCSGSVSHGVHIEPGVYTIFQGAHYDAADGLNEVIKGNGAVTLSGFTDVVFGPISGVATALPAGELRITGDNGRSSVIEVDSEGRVSVD